MVEDAPAPYSVTRTLGRGSQTTTYLAWDEAEQREVVLKRLDLSELDDWKHLELFERRIDTLAALDHAQIPTYYDSVQPDDGEAHGAWFIVQEHIDGEEMSAVLERDGPLGEDELRACLRDVLEVLDYLHRFSPPIVHRDVKPSNILRRSAEDDSSSLHGQHVLIDFGGIQNVVQDSVGGTTAFGTPGYAAPEQFMGRATPASDLYGLAATIIRLGTGRQPSDLADRQGRIASEALAELPQDLRGVVQWMAQPIPEDRPASAAEALAALDDPSTIRQPAPTGEDALARLAQRDDAPGRCAVTVSRDSVTIETPVIEPPPKNKKSVLGLAFGVTMTIAIFVVPFFPVEFIALQSAAVIGLGVYAAYSMKLPQYFRPVRERLVIDAEQIEHVVESKSGQWEVVESGTRRTDAVYLPFLECGGQMLPYEESDMVRSGGTACGLVFRGDGEDLVFGHRYVTGNRIIMTQEEAPRYDAYDDLLEVTEQLRNYFEDASHDDAA